MELQKKKLMNLRPAVVISAGLIIGILIGYLYSFKSRRVSVFSFCLVFAILLFAFTYSLFKKNRFNAVVSIFTTISCLVGLLVVREDINASNTYRGEVSFHGEVVEIYEENISDIGYYYRLVLKGDVKNGNNARVYAEMSSSKRVFQGSKISIQGDFTPTDPHSDFAFSTDIDYYALVDYDTVKVGKLNGAIPILKYKLLTTLEEFMPKTSSLVYALLTGETTYVPRAVLVKYQDVGVAHLFAVSGLHVGLIYGLLLFLFKGLKLKGGIRFSLISFILFCYVGFCGFSASSMRAFIIITVREIAFIFGLKPDKTTNLSISAFIVLIINPSDLFSAGFLLSFSVYLGLILLATPFSKFLSKIFPEFISKMLSSCIVAHLVSFPILLDYFGEVSVFGFLFNMALIPFVSFLYPFILLSSILLCVFQTSFFAILPNLAFALPNKALYLANTQLFMIRDFKLSYSCIFYYLFLYSFAGKINLSAKSYNILRIIILLAFILTFSAILY